MSVAASDEDDATVPLRLRDLDARDPASFAPDGTERTAMWIVQFADAPTTEDRALLARNGAEIVDYLPQNAYMIFDVKGSAVTDIQNSMSAPSTRIRLLAPFRSTDAIDPRLLDDAVWTGRARAGDAPPGEVTVHIVVADVPGFGKLDADFLEGTFLKGRDTVGSPMGCRYRIIGTTLRSLQEVEEIATLETVVNVELAPPMELFGESTAQIIANRTSGSPELPLAPGGQATGTGSVRSSARGFPSRARRTFPSASSWITGSTTARFWSHPERRRRIRPTFSAPRGKIES